MRRPLKRWLRPPVGGAFRPDALRSPVRRGAACGLLALAAASPSEVTCQERDAGEELRDAATDVLHVWSQPTRLDADDLLPLSAVAGLTALTITVDDDVQRWVDGHPDVWVIGLLAPFREDGALADVGRSRFLVPLSTALWLAGVAADEAGLRDAGMGCATANLATTVSRHLIGRVTGRARPHVSADPLDFRPGWAAWERRSFPGGHGSNVTACTSFLSHRFDLGTAEPLLWALSSGVALARVVDRDHWLSDTLFALVYGWAVGRVVAERFEGRSSNGSSPGARNAPPAILRVRWTVPTSSKSLLPFIL